MAKWSDSERLEHFFSKCTDDGGCLRWNGRVTRDNLPYANVGGGKIGSVRKFVYEAVYRTIPKGFNAVMKCKCTECINPDHMGLKDVSVILKDAMKNMTAESKIRRNRGSLNRFRQVLNIEKAREIRASNDDVLTLAARYGIHKRTVRDVLNYDTWKETTSNPFSGLIR